MISPTRPIPTTLIVLLLAPVLAACSTPSGIRFAPEPNLAHQTESIFVATNRQPGKMGDFSGQRDTKLHFARYGISIPEDHKTGQIEWPSGQVDPRRNFSVTALADYQTAGSFKKSLNRALDNPANRSEWGDREVILFSHGYNTDFSEGLYRSAQIKFDYGVKTPMVHYSWPSAGDTGLYVYDRDSVKTSRDHLAQLIGLITTSKADRVLLVAHSLGTELLMESLRQMALANGGRLHPKIGGVVLISPDVDIDVFNNQLEAIQKLPKQFVIFVSRKDKALEISNFLTGDNGRVGNNVDTNKIKRAGITLFDVTDFDGGDDLHHFTTVTSPSLVALLKGMSRDKREDMFKKPGQEKTVTEAVIDTATLPVSLVVKTTKQIFSR